jgi:hypothetical protein
VVSGPDLRPRSSGRTTGGRSPIGRLDGDIGQIHLPDYWALADFPGRIGMRIVRAVARAMPVGSG